MVRPEHNDQEDPRGPVGRQQVIEILQAYREQLRQLGVKKISLFGSAARGSLRPDSDVDILVDLEKGRSALALGGILMDLQDLLGKRVEVVTTAALHPKIRDNVLSQAIDL